MIWCPISYSICLLVYSKRPSSSSTIPATAPETDDATTTTVIITINKINAKNVNINPSDVIPLPQPFIPDISFPLTI